MLILITITTKKVLKLSVLNLNKALKFEKMVLHLPKLFLIILNKQI